MGATVCYTQYNPADKGEWAGKGSLHSALKECFGELPIVLKGVDIPTLKGIAAGGVKDAENLIEGIHKLIEIEVTVGY